MTEEDRREAERLAEEYAQIWSKDYRASTGHMGELAFKAGYAACAEKMRAEIEALQEKLGLTTAKYISLKFKKSMERLAKND